VITYSSGNHAQGVAARRGLLGAPAVVVMPSDAPSLKKAPGGGRRAEVVVVGTSSDERQRWRRSWRSGAGSRSSRPSTTTGSSRAQGTVGLEIVEDLPDVAAVVVSDRRRRAGSGVAVALRALAPCARLIGVEPELAADARQSLAEGRIVRWPAADVVPNDRDERGRWRWVAGRSLTSRDCWMRS
jgi:threonine dehydratase